MFASTVQRDEKGRFVPGVASYIPSRGERHSIATEFKPGMKPWNLGKKCSQISGPNHGRWRGGLPKCPRCLTNNKSRRAKHCRPCSSILRTGPLNHAWIEDRTKLKKQNRRGDPLYHEWRKTVFFRDNYTCRMRNEECDSSIEAHHILGWSVYPDGRYDINNGITLCRSHHPRRREEEARLAPIFMEIVSASNATIH